MVVGALVALASATCAVVHIVNPPRKTYRYVVPEGMHGKFLLRCSVPGAPPLPLEDGYRLVRFDATSRTVDTADEYVFGNEWYDEQHLVAGLSGRRKVDADCRPFPSMEHVRVDVTCVFP